MDFFAVAGAKQVLKSFNKSTLTQLWCHCARANQAAAPSARRDLIAGLRKVVEQAGNRHLTELPSLDVLRSVAVGLKVPLTRNNPSKVECAKRITEYLQDNGLDFMLDRLDDAQLAALCEALGMVLAVGEGEQPLDRHRRSLSIRAAINSAGLHSFMASLDVALVEQMAKDVGMPLTEDHPGDKVSKKRNKKGALITYILTTAHQGGHQAGPGSSTAAAADEVAKEKTEEKTEEKGKETEEKIEEKGKEKADGEEDGELDLDNLAQYPLAKLKAYCVEEQLTVAKPATKKSYIAAITAHNDRLAREEEEAELHKQKRKENKMKEKELITATTSPAVASAPPSSSSSSSSGAAAAVTSPTPKRYKMLTLVKSETLGAKTAVASPAPARQETTTPQTPTKAPVAEVATPKSKGRKRAREEEQAPRKEAPLAPASSSSGTSNDDAVCEVLSGIGLAKYAAKFAAEEIDMAALLLLDEGHLVALGMPLGSRIKLLQQISILKEEERQRQGSSSSKKPRKAEAKSDEENEKENENEDKNEENEDEKEAEAEAPKPVRRAKRRRSEFEQLAEQQKKWERRLEAREKRRSFTPDPLGDLVLQEGGGEAEKEEEKEGDVLQPNQEPVGVAGLANDTAGVIDLVGA